MIEESLIKSNFLGRDGFIWWIGQIAPEEAQGAERVRHEPGGGNDRGGFPGGEGGRGAWVAAAVRDRATSHCQTRDARRDVSV